jgi:hypothetical protein
MKSNFLISCLLLCLIGGFYSCKKDNSGAGSIPAAVPGYELTYGDSIFYLNGQATDYIVTPLQARQGVYSGFPQGVQIDSKTGAIDISKSETGLRYRITFVPDGTTDSFNTLIVISGVNYLDGFYRLNTADSIARPVYNATLVNLIPGIHNGSIFDDGSNCNRAGCNVNVTDGTINLAQTVRNGVFGAVPSSNARQQFQMNYRINDKSSETLNTIQIKIYYFDSINDVSQEVYDIITSRQGALLDFKPTALPFESVTGVDAITQVNGQGKPPPQPRPPCIFILAR